MKLTEENLVLRGDYRVVKKHDILGAIIIMLGVIGWAGMISAIVFGVAIVQYFGTLDAELLILGALLLYLFIYHAFLCKRQCPFCRHFNCLKQIGWRVDKGYTQSSVSRTASDSFGGAIISTNGVGLYAGEIQHRENGIRTTEHYNINIKCMACGCVFKKAMKAHHDTY
ncbi:MAG: hypothetical protein ACI4KA_06310 [Oscillospiraceae bacterium]